MKIIKNYFVLAENAFFGSDKKASIINIYDVILATNVPALHGKLIFIGNITIDNPNKENKEIIAELSIKSPSGKEMISSGEKITQEINTELSTQNISMIFQVERVVLAEYGFYNASVFINNDEAMSLKFEVKKPAS